MALYPLALRRRLGTVSDGTAVAGLYQLNAVIFWLNFLEGPKTNSELGRKRRQVRGTQSPFPLADGADITISFPSSAVRRNHQA